MTYEVLLLMMTWADAELAFRGRGPPPVPRRISLVFALWASLLRGSDTSPVSAIAPARKARRLRSRTVWLLCSHILQRTQGTHQRANRLVPGLSSTRKLPLRTGPAGSPSSPSCLSYRL